MILNLGQTLKSAREAKGLAAEDIAERTNVLVQIVRGLECGDYRKIPAPIYGRGFVRLYCEQVGLDPVPCVDAFMREFTNGHAYVPPPEKTSPEKPVTEPTGGYPPPSDAPDALPPMEETPRADDAPDAIPAAETPRAGDVPDAIPEQPPRLVGGLDLFDPPPQAKRTDDSQYRSPFAADYDAPPESDGSSAAERFRGQLSAVSHGLLSNIQQMPRNVWRMVLVVGVCLAVIFLAIFGCRALYRLAQPAAEPGETETDAYGERDLAPAAAQPAGKTVPDETSAGRPQSIDDVRKGTGKLHSSGENLPPLYAD